MEASRGVDYDFVVGVAGIAEGIGAHRFFFHLVGVGTEEREDSGAVVVVEIVVDKLGSLVDQRLDAGCELRAMMLLLGFLHVLKVVEPCCRRDDTFFGENFKAGAARRGE